VLQCNTFSVQRKRESGATKPFRRGHPYPEGGHGGHKFSQFFFTKRDLASSYHQLRVLALDRWKTSFRLQLGQF
jgi:hypothetical protein